MLTGSSYLTLKPDYHRWLTFVLLPFRARQPVSGLAEAGAPGTAECGGPVARLLLRAVAL